MQRSQGPDNSLSETVTDSDCVSPVDAEDSPIQTVPRARQHRWQTAPESKPPTMRHETFQASRPVTRHVIPTVEPQQSPTCHGSCGLSGARNEAPVSIPPPRHHNATANASKFDYHVCSLLQAVKVAASYSRRYLSSASYFYELHENAFHGSVSPKPCTKIQELSGTRRHGGLL